jgi:hypothetical protein
MRWIAEDGRVRISLDELLVAPISHLITVVDAEPDEAPPRCGSVTTLSGYTEWGVLSQPGISIGWDWLWEGTTPVGAGWVRAGLPRTNLLLVDERGADLDWTRSLQVLATVVDAIPWRERLLAA